MNSHRLINGCSRAIVLVVALAMGQWVRGDDAPRAARSVHLHYILPPAVHSGVTEFYNEVTVEKSVPGSYFEVCGFNSGYFGIQQVTNKKVGIFSVWDPADGDKKELAPDQRVKILFVGDGVRHSEFHGEGTGGHTDFDCDWSVGAKYCFFLKCWIDGDRTIYDAWFADPNVKGWKHVAMLSTPNGGEKMTGLYSFIEDFRRDTKSASEVRRAAFSNEWVRDENGEWLALTKAKFTASSATWEAKDTIDAGAEGDHFYLQTGGASTMHNPLNEVIEHPLTKR